MRATLSVCIATAAIILQPYAPDRASGCDGLHRNRGANAWVRDVTGQTPVVFGPPYAAFDQKVVDIARATGLAIVLWSIYPERLGSFSSSAAVGGRVIATVRDGDIVFLHDTSMRSIDVTRSIIQDLSAKGFGFLTVPELIRRRGNSRRVRHIERDLGQAAR